MRRPRRAVLIVVLGLCSAATTSFEPPAVAAPSQSGGCSRDYCVDDIEVLPGAEDDVVPATGGGAPGPRCHWSRTAAPQVVGDSPGAIPEPEGTRTDDAYLVFEICDGQNSGRIRWADPASPTAEPSATPEALALVLHARLEGDLPAPVVESTPEQGVPSIVSYPTFVAVANWTGVVTATECDPSGLLCVTASATPSLSFAPGEPDAPTITCAGSGTQFVIGGPESRVQASAPGACAYAYQRRSAEPGRPPEWPGVVTVTWQLVWSSTSGRSGTLPDVSKSADLPRAVNEVQAVAEG